MRTLQHWLLHPRGMGCKTRVLRCLLLCGNTRASSSLTFPPGFGSMLYRDCLRIDPETVDLRTGIDFSGLPERLDLASVFYPFQESRVTVIKIRRPWWVRNL